jgi:hypothetical protein
VKLEVTLSAGMVQSADLRSDRPVSLCRALLGRNAEDLPAAFERLYALCGRAHRIAARFAIDAARFRESTDAARRRAVRDLAAERAGEHLRSSFTTAVALQLAVEPAELQAVRAAVAATRPGAEGSGLAAALGVLGLDGEPPRPASWAGRMLAEAGAHADAAAPVDALSPADDPAVLAALAASGGAYAARPHLPSRRPETGPLARCGGTGAPRDRLAARFAEIRHAAAVLSDQAEDRPADWIASETLPGGTGFAAVETPRGRMHHLAAVDAGDRVTGYAVLAPTEWNFHPDGPLIHALRGRRVGSGAAAEARIRWLVGLFDPCVACALELREAAYA